MIPIAINDVLQVTVEGTNERMPWAWVSHLLVTAVVDTAGMVDAVATFYADLLTSLAPELTDEWQAECIKINRVAPAPMGTLFDETAYPIVGAVATDGIPNTAAAVIRFGSDEPGASNRGRMFLCGIPEEDTDGGQLTASKVTDLQTALTSILTGVNNAGNTAPCVIFSRSLYGTDPPGHPANVADYTSLITSIEPMPNLGTIRNRRFTRPSPAP